MKLIKFLSKDIFTYFIVRYFILFPANTFGLSFSYFCYYFWTHYNGHWFFINILLNILIHIIIFAFVLALIPGKEPEEQDKFLKEKIRKFEELRKNY